MATTRTMSLLSVPSAKPAGHSPAWPVADTRTQRVRFGGVEFNNLTMEEAVLRVASLARGNMPSMVVTPNVDHVLRLQEDAEFAGLVARAEMVVADGQPIVWATRLLGKPLKERVAGSDLVPAVCAHAAKTGLRVFFFGGAPGSAAAAEQKLSELNPGLRSVGHYCPDYGFEKDPIKNDEALRIIREARPDILFVGLGSPKQERWIADHMDAYQVPVSLGIGVTFSFIAGDIKRAPRWMQKSGLEWFHRLCSEPGRLWHRYLVRGPMFVGVLAREFVMAQPADMTHQLAAHRDEPGTARQGIRLPLALDAMRTRGINA